MIFKCIRKEKHDPWLMLTVPGNELMNTITVILYQYIHI